MQQIIGGLIFLGIMLLLVVAAIYFARGQKPKAEHYGSWSNVLGPQFRGSAFDVREKLNKDIARGREQAHHEPQHHSSRDKEE